MRTLLPIVAGAFVVASALLSSTHEASAQATKALGKFNDWTAYVHEGTTRICFVSAAPRSSQPTTAGRAAVQLFISGWPKEGIRAEFSAKLGFATRKGSEVTATVGPAAFKLFTEDERAFVADPTAELKLIEAMRKGSTMQLQSVPETGVAVRDTFSLLGLGQAMQAMQTSCGS